MSGYDNPTMDRLALEDQQKDSYVAVIVREESGGSLGILSLLGLSLLGLSRTLLKFRRGELGAKSSSHRHVD